MERQGFDFDDRARHVRMEGITNITIRAATPPRMALSTLGIVLFYQISVIKSTLETPGEAFRGLLFSGFFVKYCDNSLHFRRNWAKNDGWNLRYSSECAFTNGKKMCIIKASICLEVIP